MKILNQEHAIRISVEIAKLICSNPETKGLYPNKVLAADIAEFVDTLSDKLSGKTENE